MSHVEYMILHRRMYAIADKDSFYICLSHHNPFPEGEDFRVSIEVTRSAFNLFTNYEMDFNLLLSLFGALCIKYASIPF